MLAAISVTLPDFPPAYKITFVPNCVVTNMMAGRVYRHTKFGHFQEESISTRRMIQQSEGQAEPGIYGASGAPVGSYSGPDSLESRSKLVSGTESHPSNGSYRPGFGWRTPVLFILTLALTIIPPTVCVYLCRRRNHLWYLLCGSVLLVVDGIHRVYINAKSMK